MLRLLTESETEIAPEPELAGAGAGQSGWRRHRGWAEAAIIFAAYQAFEWVRARVQGQAGPSFRHARQVIRWEQAVGLFQEARIQSWFLPHHLIIELWDIWYGTIHFVIPPLALVVLYHRCPERYRQRRDALISLTLLGLVFFWLWPLAPPRLLPASYHFVDTAKRIGGMGVADKGSLADDNAYAAMPSLHIAWSSWCVVALLPVLRRWWTRALAVLYPFVTLAAVVITANHFVLDGAGGLVVLGAGWLVALGIERLRRGPAVDLR
jgi:PAP2 superfamily